MSKPKHYLHRKHITHPSSHGTPTPSPPLPIACPVAPLAPGRRAMMAAASTSPSGGAEAADNSSDKIPSSSTNASGSRGGGRRGGAGRKGRGGGARRTPEAVSAAATAAADALFLDPSAEPLAAPRVGPVEVKEAAGGCQGSTGGCGWPLVEHEARSGGCRLRDMPSDIARCPGTNAGSVSAVRC